MLRPPASACIIAILVFGFYAYFHQAGGYNQNCRFDTVRALVEHGTHVIDRFHHNTEDKAFFEGHHYCDKAPLVSWLATPAYALSRAVLSGRTDEPTVRVAGFQGGVLLAVALPSALAAGLFYWWLLVQGVGRWASVGLALSYALASLVFPYSTTLFGHSLAAALLMASVVAVSVGTASGPSWLIAVGGFAAGWAVVAEYPAVVGAAGLALYTARSPRSLKWLVAGAALPAGVLLIFNWTMWGHPFSLSYGASTHFTMAEGVGFGYDGFDPSRIVGLWFSEYRGLFVSAPWLLLAFPGIAVMVAGGRNRGLGWLCLAVSLAFVASFACFLLWDGGWTLGARYLIPSIPFLAVAVAGLFFPRELQLLAGRRMLSATLVVSSLFSFALMFMGTAVKVDVPSHYRKPFREFVVPNFLEQKLGVSTHDIDRKRSKKYSAANRRAWNLGELAGLSGWASLLPLAAFALGVGMVLRQTVRIEEAQAGGEVADSISDEEPAPAATAATAATWATLRERWYVAACVGACVLTAAALLPQWWADAPPMNDSVLHETVAGYVARNWNDHWPVDPWFPLVTTGLPLFAIYPHLSHLTSAAVAAWSPWPISGEIAYRALGYVLITLMPLSIYLSLRQMRLAAEAALAAAVLFPLMSSPGLFGASVDSYLWGGHGLIAQLWGVFLMFPALGWGHRALRTGRTWAAAALLSLCCLGHFLFGYAAALSLALLALIPHPGISLATRLQRLARLGLWTAMATAYFTVPFLMHRSVLLRSRWEPTWKWDSTGAEHLWGLLLRGEVFDREFAVVTACVVVGAAVCLWESRRRQASTARWLVVSLLVWFALSFGRHTWGSLIDVLPMSSGLHMHRFVAVFQVFGVIVGGLGIAGLGRLLLSWSGSRGLAVVAILALLAAPAMSRWERLQIDLDWQRQVVAAIEDDPALPPLLDALRTKGPGRVHAGFAGNWGNHLKLSFIPFYTLLQVAGFDMTGYLFTAMVRPADWQVLMHTNKAGQTDLFNVRYIVAPAGRDRPRHAIHSEWFGPYALHEVPSSGYFAVGQVSGEDGEALSFDGEWMPVFERGRDWMLRLGDPAKTYVTLRGSEDVSPRAGAPTGRVLHESLGPGWFGGSVQMDRDGYVILKASRHPFWRSWVDDEPVEHREVIPGFMAVPVRRGIHQISFSYEPPPWKKGLFGVAVLVVAGAFIRPRRSGLLDWEEAES